MKIVFKLVKKIFHKYCSILSTERNVKYLGTSYGGWHFSDKNLSKNTEIEYCIDSAKITSITNLIYDEENKEYSIKIQKKNTKSITTKSKSNIDRHFSRSKSNRKD